jgi:hypothetical protein
MILSSCLMMQCVPHVLDAAGRPTLSSRISKFGVGAIHAGFFIGTRVKVLTRTQVRRTDGRTDGHTEPRSVALARDMLVICGQLRFGIGPAITCGTLDVHMPSAKSVSPPCRLSFPFHLFARTVLCALWCPTQDSRDVRCFVLDEASLQERYASKSALYKDDVLSGDW